MSNLSTSFEPFLPTPTPTPGDEDLLPIESTSSAPEATPSPPTLSSPPSNQSTADPQPPESSPAAPLRGDSSSSPAPPSESDLPPPSPPLNSSTPPDSPPSLSSSPPAPSISSPIQQSPPADPPTSQKNSPSHSPPTIAVPTPPISPPTPPISPPPSGSHEPLPPAQQTSPPSRETPPGDHPSPPATPGSSLGTPTIDPTPTQTPPSPPSKSTSAASHQTPRLSPPPHSQSESSNQKSSPSTSHSSRGSESEAITGAVLAVGVLVAFAVLLVVCVRKRKKRAKSYASNYRPPAGTYSVKSDGYYYRQAGIGVSTQPDSQYGSIPSMVGNSIGSQKGHGFESGAIGYSKSSFTYEELIEITDGFSQGNVLGEGGFGCVYKGRLKDGREVAVKQLKTGSGQGEREFRAEVEIISRVHHRHLVSLVGYCISENQRLLVYEFVPNNNLEHHLHGQGGLPVMDWYKRLKIAVGAAKGLAYLHEDCHPRIIHRDIKSANILLDNSFEAQVADFGLAKLTNDTSTHVSTRVMGTFGYMAPEYASSGKLTDRSDVYSFGVVLLELVTGRKPVDTSQPLGQESLVEWLPFPKKYLQGLYSPSLEGWGNWLLLFTHPMDIVDLMFTSQRSLQARPVLMRALESGDCDELVDPRLENNYVRSEMFRMIETAAACVRYSAPKRPRMVQVVRALDCEGDMPDLTGGVKFGQSTIFQSGQNAADLQMFRRMAFGSHEFTSEYSGTSGEYERRSPSYSGEYDQRAPPHSGEYQNHTGGPSYRSLNNWNGGDYTSGEYTSSNESETHAMSRRGSERSQGEAPVGYGSHWLRET